MGERWGVTGECNEEASFLEESSEGNEVRQRSVAEKTISGGVGKSAKDRTEFPQPLLPQGLCTVCSLRLEHSLIPSLHSGFCSNAILTEAVLTTLPEIALPPFLITPVSYLLYFC